MKNVEITRKPKVTPLYMKGDKVLTTGKACYDGDSFVSGIECNVVSMNTDDTVTISMPSGKLELVQLQEITLKA